MWLNCGNTKIMLFEANETQRCKFHKVFPQICERLK